MKQPLQINFRDIPPSEAVEAKIREKAAKLDEFYDHIMACTVMVASPHGHHHKGNLFHVSIDLTVPNGELVINRSPKDHHAHEDVYVAIRDAFNAARRKLQDYIRKQRGDVKHHEVPPHGIVSELVPYQDFGRIMSADGREIYFHRNSLIDGDFDGLVEGDKVRFSEVAGDNGPQASTVHLIGKHNIVG
ncbi:MAG: HPF/RaiA family ribosome-associated protein [Gammaproteobacteria bacterium]|nr:HPF/RaiA family ribosome-associated protein [Gammaproteobacteria bacterium]MDH5735823.1 HPF/RaiA family ribosome-associated protein [Gammaproteobacteria bacterium]